MNTQHDKLNFTSHAGLYIVYCFMLIVIKSFMDGGRPLMMKNIWSPNLGLTYSSCDALEWYFLYWKFVKKSKLLKILTIQYNVCFSVIFCMWVSTLGNASKYLQCWVDNFPIFQHQPRIRNHPLWRHIFWNTKNDN